ncbi:class I SAM-dependent methyltransferase [Metabacillus iocasae]|uniref:SAM-dependent MidA family methyltransferase n=1 Tax=Priestia iocasae TaxID=2291674 RepID=A0ABS2QQ25_9BACI|nr:SAM-dependent methyltransferase [Metabacillus iocasae]MBM7701541.1 SAM-dependent MidA family methyltransferase [Metabacillus iocasae]
MQQAIKKRIKDSLHNRISYSEYMNIALYDDEHGYYMKHAQKVGKHGDFLTTSELSSAFGRAMAHLFVKVVEHHLLPPIICEIGGGNGKFAEVVIDEWKKISPNTVDQLTYYMIEKSSYHQQLQRNELFSNQLIYFKTVEEFLSQVGEFNGIVFSNEWFDALPVEVIEKKDGLLYEVWITLEGNRLVETYIPVTNQHILNYLSTYNLSIAEGQRFEIPLDMIKAIERLGVMVKSGIVVTVDYGYTFQEWEHPARRRGSLRGYMQHQLVEDPLQNIGEMDLTTHIHFDSLIEKGKQCGLQLTTFKRQREFLLMIGLLQLLEEHTSTDPFSNRAKANRSIRSLLMEGSISDYFHVIIQHKNLELEESFLIDLIKHK